MFKYFLVDQAVPATCRQVKTASATEEGRNDRSDYGDHDEIGHKFRLVVCA
jgi:hypothetical protein